MDSNNYSMYGTSAPEGTTPSTGDTSSGASSSPYSAYGSSNSSPYSAYGATSSSPLTGQPQEPAQHIYQDSSQPWYKRAWDFANTPLTESVLGWPEERQGAGGFERAVEHIASGLTSPLSVALTAATFGGGGLIESAGATALKEAGLSAAEIADVAKASEAALKATQEMKPIEPTIKAALEAGGHDIGLLQRAKELTGPGDLTDRFMDPAFQESKLIEGETKPGILEQKGFSEEERAALAKSSQAVADAKAGFKPVEDAVRASGANVDKWREAQDILYKHGLSEHDLLGGNALERGAFQILRKVAPDLPIALPVRMAKTANSLLSAGFTLQQFEVAAAMSPRFFDDLKNGDIDAAWEHGTEAAVGGGLGVLGAGHALSAWGELTDPLLSPKLKPSDQTLAVNRLASDHDALHDIASTQGKRLDQSVRDALGHKPPRAILGDTKEVKAQKDLDLATVIHNVVSGGDQNTTAQVYNAWSEAAERTDRLDVQNPVNGLDEKLRQSIQDNKFKNHPKEYQDLMLDSMKAVAKGNLPENILKASEIVRNELNQNFEMGVSNGFLHDYIENYMSRWYNDENPEGKVVTQQAKNGKFETNVTMARQRVYDSHWTAVLKSPKTLKMDPADIAAGGREMTLKAAANKQFMDGILSQGLVGSDGRPIAFLDGEGRVVSGPNGEDPKMFIDPRKVKKTSLSDKAIEGLTKSGSLERFLADGSIKDMTPYVHPDNAADVLNHLEDQAVSKTAQYDEVGNNKLQTQIMFLKSMIANNDFSGLKDFNEALKKQYAWNPSGYISVDHNAMRGWNFVVNDPRAGKVFVNSNIRLHPEFADYIKNRLGIEKSGISQDPIGKAALGLNTKLKKTLLSLSPFHMVQEALRGLMVGVNPITAFKDALADRHPDIMSGDRVDPNDPNSPTKIYKGVQHGLTTGIDYKSMQEHSEGVAAGGGGVLRRIPGIGKTLDNSMNWYEDFLFKRYIPALKARGYELMFDRYREAHPDWEIDRVAKAAASHTNDTFGGINWKAMGRSATTQDWGRLMLLAPDWLESEMRSGARLFNKEGGIGRAQVAKMALGMWGIARVLNYASTGGFHNEAPFGLVVKNKEGKETVFGIRTLPTDLLHAATDPVNFIKGRLSPGIGSGIELLTGRDRFQRKLQPYDLWVDTFRNMAPIPAQSLGQVITNTGPEVGNVGQAWKAVGGTAQAYQTPAGKMAADLAASHSEDGFVDPAQQARHRMIIRFEDMARAGELSQPDLMKLTYQTDQLTKSELKKIQTNIKATKDMDPTTAALYTRATRLPAKEYLQLLDVANSTEKTALIPLTKKVWDKYLSKGRDKMTPEERAKDPVYQRFLRMIPPQPQTEQ